MGDSTAKSGLEQFREDYSLGRLIFFAGAGVSCESGAVMPTELLRAAAKLFMPTDPELAPLVDDVLDAAAAPGLDFPGIQPEIFYEHLLTLSRDPAVLGLWRILSPDWLAGRGAALRPNANHVALAAYSARHRLPLFTTNFDMLFEEAAHLLNICVARNSGVSQVEDGERKVPTLHLYKLHGSIMVDGAERLDTLQATMQSITAINEPMLDLIESLSRSHRFAFVGYSGCDIDYFPIMAAHLKGRGAYWFPRGHKPTLAHAAQIDALCLDADLQALFADLEGRAPVDPVSFDPSLLEPLKAEAPTRLSEAQKILFLAQCQQSTGRNAEAERCLARLGKFSRTLAARDWIEALLLRSRVNDCTSNYVQSERSARAALREIRGAKRKRTLTPAEAVALRARALYLLDIARQQQLGPIVGGDPHLAWRPSFPAMLLRLVSGLRTSVRLGWARRRLERLVLPDERPHFLRTEHAINDHSVVLLGGLISVSEGTRLIRFPPLAWWFHARIRKLLGRARKSGDYFAIAHAQKYLNRLRRIDERDQALETYGLLRDPLNFALVCRDSGIDLLKLGDAKGAEEQFARAGRAAMACGSKATLVKSLAGLSACRLLSDDEIARMREAGASIEGRGYRRYWREKLEPFIARHRGTACQAATTT